MNFKSSSFSKFSVLALLALAIPSASFASPVIRCAFDIGSKETKMTATAIDTETHEVKELLHERVVVPFKKSVVNGEMPDSIIIEGSKKIKELKDKCIAVGATQFAGVATSGFRTADKPETDQNQVIRSNGQNQLEHLSDLVGIPLTLISGEREAELGLEASAAHLKTDIKNIVSFDIGGGSSEFAMLDDNGKLVPFSVPRGADSFHDDLVLKFARLPDKDKKIRLNPVSAKEMRISMKMAVESAKLVPEQIRQKIASGDVHIVGPSATHIFVIGQEAGMKTDNFGDYYDIDSVVAAIKRTTSLDDPALLLAYPTIKITENEASDLALIYSFMKRLKIQKIYPIDLNLGNGLVVDSEVTWGSK